MLSLKTTVLRSGSPAGGIIRGTLTYRPTRGEKSTFLCVHSAGSSLGTRPPLQVAETHFLATRRVPAGYDCSNTTGDQAELLRGQMAELTSIRRLTSAPRDAVRMYVHTHSPFLSTHANPIAASCIIADACQPSVWCRSDGRLCLLH